MYDLNPIVFLYLFTDLSCNYHWSLYCWYTWIISTNFFIQSININCNELRLTICIDPNTINPYLMKWFLCSIAMNAFWKSKCTGRTLSTLLIHKEINTFVKCNFLSIKLCCCHPQFLSVLCDHTHTHTTILFWLSFIIQVDPSDRFTSYHL